MEQGKAGGRKIVVIDDDMLVAQAIGRMVRHLGEVILVHGAREFLAFLEAGGPCDVVICDMIMPQISGVQLYRRLEAEQPELAARMVFVTGGALGPEASRFMAEIGGRLLLKPFPAQALRELVEKLDPPLATADAGAPELGEARSPEAPLADPASGGPGLQAGPQG